MTTDCRRMTKECKSSHYELLSSQCHNYTMWSTR